jgi:pilus assembly protein Flp/PilA
MKKFNGLFARFRKDEDGATAIEYGLLAALIAIGIIAAASTLRDDLNNTFGTVSTELSSASAGAGGGGGGAPAPAPTP